MGLMSAYSGILRGASNVYVVDRVKDRLDAAKKMGCIPIDFTQGDPVEQIIKLNGKHVKSTFLWAAELSWCSRRRSRPCGRRCWLPSDRRR